MSRSVVAYHFLADPTKLAHTGETLPPVGKRISLAKGVKPVLCKTGFHGSMRPLDAISFAPGPYLCRVRLSGIVVKGDDKCVASARTLLTGPVDVSVELRIFAAHQALAAADAAEKVLPNFEKVFPDDKRVREAIAQARKTARVVLAHPAESAARSAAGSAARSAAGSAAE